MKNKDIEKVINKKKKELRDLVYIKNSLQDKEVYRKSCELDELVVKYMRATG
ncbi:MAG: Spo0E like sporulation regulatory protein [Clostridia bacterium]|jgi:hypothetical protein|nr:Spo0E like sporulation regulatory protein [Clostridiales bacterium]MDK2986197.1 Spo0E like sporulation regulatory protein [Clostridia bacterium]